MSKALVIIKSMGIGDLCILISSIHAISIKIGKPVTVLAQKNTKAHAILENDPHVVKVIELEKNEMKKFFQIVKKIKLENFSESYIYSDSIRFFLISKMSGIKNCFHYKFFSKKEKNFFKTAKLFTEKTLNIKVDTQSKIYLNKNTKEIIKKKYNILDDSRNIVCGISASGPTKRWDINNYIKLFENLNSKMKCRFFLAGGVNDETLIKKIVSSSLGKNCVSFSSMTIADAIPVIGNCKYYIGNDTGWGHIASGLGLRSLFLFMDSPPAAYGTYSKNISIVLPEGETIDTCGHNTLGKDKILFKEVLIKTLELLN